MSEKQGYDKVKYDSGYEKEHDRRDMRIRGCDPLNDMPMTEMDDSGDGGFVERNNVRERL